MSIWSGLTKVHWPKPFISGSRGHYGESRRDQKLERESIHSGSFEEGMQPHVKNVGSLRSSEQLMADNQQGSGEFSPASYEEELNSAAHPAPRRGLEHYIRMRVDVILI